MGWDFKTCLHGITEGLDSHDCPECLKVAEELGYDITKGQTYIFTSQEQIDHLKKKKSVLQK